MLGIYVKADPTYAPIKDPSSRRWHVRTPCGEFELLTTGPKWWDTRAERGGGGAIDLAMHLLDVSFLDAVKLLTELRRCFDSQMLLCGVLAGDERLPEKMRRDDLLPLGSRMRKRRAGAKAA